ncbi:hypothetical protein [Streptomyces sp. NPDC088707]|uniref:hypothetical protein n=1 Tax=Streptomyces sp. NPDC088707 TaxID=3365871 RepID=UPI00382A4896
MQVIIDADSRPVIASARPAPGNMADAHVWREPGLPATAAGTTAIADGTYLGTGRILPHRRRAGRPPARPGGGQRRTHRQVRARVEHTSARMKNGKPFREGRQKGDASTTPPGRRHYAQPRHDTMNQQARSHFGLQKQDLLQHPSDRREHISDLVHPRPASNSTPSPSLPSAAGALNGSGGSGPIRV